MKEDSTMEGNKKVPVPAVFIGKLKYLVKELK